MSGQDVFHTRRFSVVEYTWIEATISRQFAMLLFSTLVAHDSVCRLLVRHDLHSVVERVNTRLH